MRFLSCLDYINIFMKDANSPPFFPLPFDRLMKLSSLCERVVGTGSFGMSKIC